MFMSCSSKHLPACHGEFSTSSPVYVFIFIPGPSAVTAIPSKFLCECDLWPRVLGWPQMEIRICVSQSPHPTPSVCSQNQNHEPSPMIMLLTWTHLRLESHGYCIINIPPAWVKLAWVAKSNLICQCGMTHKVGPGLLVRDLYLSFFNRTLYSPVWPRILLSLAWMDTTVPYLPSKWSLHCLLFLQN